MPGSNSVIRRYTPPTCTLEILAQSSPLSRWMGQTVLNQLRFQLHFDDPTLPEESKITIQGDRDQIEVLCHAVTNYVQELLQKSADSFYLTSLGSQPSTTVTESSELSELSEQSESKDAQPTPANKSHNTAGMGILEATIYLEAGENLTHKLYLGSLANQTSGSIIQLSLLQLFDLATALDEYATDVITLPNLKEENSDSKPVFTLPAWTPLAAMVVLALGLTPLTWQYANNLKSNQPKTAKNPTSTPETVAIKPSPFAGLEAPTNLSSPPQDSDKIKLPNLDSVTPLPESSTIPNPLSFPDATVSPPITIPPKTTQTIPRISQPVIPPILPPTSTSNAQKSATEIIKFARIPVEQESRNIEAQNSPSSYKIPESTTKFPNNVENLENFNSENISSVSQPQLNEDNNSLDTANNLPNNNDLVGRLRNSKTTTKLSQLAAEENQLFDSPQVTEARTFLQKNWQPPAGLSETLEYSLILGVDGTIERILPLNKAARDFVDNTGLPAIGKPFVSTNKAGQNLRLRVVLTPDGNVKTFAEKQ